MHGFYTHHPSCWPRHICHLRVLMVTNEINGNDASENTQSFVCFIWVPWSLSRVAAPATKRHPPGSPASSLYLMPTRPVPSAPQQISQSVAMICGQGHVLSTVISWSVDRMAFTGSHARYAKLESVPTNRCLVHEARLSKAKLY